MEVVRCEKLLEELAGLVSEIKQHFAAEEASRSTTKSDREEVLITDDDTSLQKFCLVLEKILRHGIKDRLTFFGGQRDYWKYMSLALETTRSFASAVKTVQDMDDVTTSQGKGRALVRIMLMEHSLADAVQHAVSDDKLTSEWYQSDSLLRNTKHSSRFVDQLYELSDVSFILPNDGQRLDSAWPTFARRTFQSGSAVPISVNATGGGRMDTAELGQAATGEEAIDESAAAVDDLSAKVLWASQGMQAMDRTCWAGLHFLLHWMMNKKMDDDCCEGLPDHGSQRLKEFTALVILARENWKAEHDEMMAVVQKQNDRLTADLEEKANAEIALRAELSTMQQQGVSFGQGQAIAEVEALQTKLKQAEKARDSAKQQAKALEQDCEDAKKESLKLQRDVVRSAESLAGIKEQLNFVELEFTHYKEDSENALRSAEGRANSLQSQLQSASDFLDNIARAPPSQPSSPTGSSSPTRRLDLLSRLQLLNSAMQEESLKRARAEERERETSEALAETKARLDQELSTVNFRLSAESMQLQHVLEQMEAKDQELVMLKDRLATSSKDGEQTRTEIGTARIENARLSAEKETLVDKVGRLQSSLMTSQQELMALEEQLLSATRERDSERIRCLKLTTQVDEVQEKCLHAESKMREHLDELHMLRRQLMQATQQKAELVNKTADLENEVVTRAAEKWVADDEADACMMCATEFTFFTRRHHCRNCGRVFCNECCFKTFQLPSNDQPQRVCNDCHVVLTSRRQGVAKSSVYSLLTESQASVALPSSARPSLDGFAPEKSFYRPPSDTLLPAVSEKSASTISLHGSQQHMNSNFAASRESVASVTAGGRIILDAHDAVDAVEPVRAISSDTSGHQASTSNPSSRNSSARSTPIHDLVSHHRASTPDIPAGQSDSGAPPGTKPPGMFLPTTTSTPKGERKRSAPSQQLIPDMSVGPSIKSEFTSVSMQPGGLAGDAVMIRKSGMRLVWQFRSEPRGVAFGVLYQSTSTEEADAIVAFKRYLSHKQTIQGSIVAPKPGIYTLQFSNVTSSNNSCRLWYRQEVRQIRD